MVEPHYDDIFLSIGQHLMDDVLDYDIARIISVSSSSINSMNETQKLVGKYRIADQEDLKLQDYLWKDRIKDPETLEEHNRNVEFYLGEYPHSIEEIKATIANSAQDCDAIMCPVGIQHPMHMIVGQACYELALEDGFDRFMFYADNPYSMEKKFINLFGELILNRQFEIIYTADTAKEKTKIFDEIYKSQSMFQSTHCKNPETIYKIRS